MNVTWLINYIHSISNYTHKEIRKVYDDVYKKHPNRNKYYAKKAWYTRLLAFARVCEIDKACNINSL